MMVDVYRYIVIVNIEFRATVFTAKVTIAKVNVLLTTAARAFYCFYLGRPCLWGYGFFS